MASQTPAICKTFKLEQTEIALSDWRFKETELINQKFERDDLN